MYVGKANYFVLAGLQLEIGNRENVAMTFFFLQFIHLFRVI